MVRLWAALAFFLAASILTIFQSPRPDPFRRPRAFLSLSWWRYPLEWNAPGRLPKIECSLNAIYAVPNTEYVWAAGNKGMVVVSTDSGQTWTKRGIEQSQVSPAPSPSTTPTASPTPTRRPAAASFLALPDLITTTYAAEAPRVEPQAQSGVEQVGKPTPTPDPRRQFGPPPQSTGSIPTPSPTPVARPTQDTTRVQQTTAATPRPSPGSSPSASPSPSPRTIASETTPVESESLIEVHFDDANHGEAISNTATRLTTANGGISWELVPINDAAIAVEFASDYSTQGSTVLSIQRLKDKPSLVYAVLTKGNGLRSTWPMHIVASPGERSPSKLYALQLSADGSGWFAGATGSVISIHYQYAKFLSTLGSDDLHGICFINQSKGWVAGTNGAIFTTDDAGVTWQPQNSDTKSQLNSINFLPDGQHGWIAGNDGVILGTSDGGATWIQRTRGASVGKYLRLPAPWYFLVLLVVGLTLLRRAEAPAAAPEESVADVLISDRPLDQPSGDVLSFNAIALGLSRFLRNENTLPPLTIAIIGEWGTGKSSLMNLLRVDLRSYKFRPVWFNAWHHQKEEHMLASLLENIKLQAVPRWWTSRGLVFRARLLKIRGWRHWGPLLLLLFFIYVMLIYHLGQHGADSNFSGLIKNLAAPLANPISSEGASRLVTLIPLLAGVFTFFGAVWRGITAFGVKPASLLAGVSQGVSIRNLEANTSFRQKFAIEFSDVTRALGERSLLIFIDDLDRCRPENVLETLEAVNFLTTSGDCFVVIGMAREYVERCVGSAFKDIAEEMIDDVPATPAVGLSTDQTKLDSAKQKRIGFARQYLDKLINIEVPVPVANSEQSLKLLLAGASETKPIEHQTRWQEFKLTSANLIRRHWRVLPALTLLAGLGFGGYFLALSLIPDNPSTSDLVAKSEATPRAAPMITPVTTPTPSSVRPSPTPTRSPSPTPTPSNERANITRGGRALFSRNVLPIFGLLLLVWFSVTILTRRPDAIVRDSPRFVEALKIWHALTFSQPSTPRSTKRFMNHIRYLAMRQRHPIESRPLLSRMLFSWKKDATGKSELTAGSSTSDNKADVKPIPDEALVALAALASFNSKCLLVGDATLWPSVVDPKSSEWKLLQDAEKAHKEHFGAFDVMQYRERFWEMSAGVEVR